MAFILCLEYSVNIKGLGQNVKREASNKGKPDVLHSVLL